MVLHARYPVAESFHCGEPARIRGTSMCIHVSPPVFVPRPGETLLRGIQVEEPPPVHETTLAVDMGRSPVIRLYDGDAFAKVTRVAPARAVRRTPVAIDVRVRTIRDTHCASATVEVATPSMAFAVQVAPIGRDVVPAIETDDRGEPFVESERPREPPSVGGRSVRSHVMRRRWRHREVLPVLGLLLATRPRHVDDCWSRRFGVQGRSLTVLG